MKKTAVATLLLGCLFIVSGCGNNGKKEKAAITDLRVGQHVEVSFGDNPVAESYPVQSEAEQIVILASRQGQ